MSASKKRRKKSISVRLEKNLNRRDPVAEHVTKMPSGPMDDQRKEEDWKKEIDDWEETDEEEDLEEEYGEN